MDPLHIASDAAVESALRDVGLWNILASSRITGTGTTPTPSTILSTIFPLDSLLSHGQRQLLSLARALLRRQSSPIVILDEATASMDPDADARVQELIREKFAGKTLIVIAHRLNTIADFDRVVVMREGRVAEVGRPRDVGEVA